MDSSELQLTKELTWPAFTSLQLRWGGGLVRGWVLALGPGKPPIRNEELVTHFLWKSEFLSLCPYGTQLNSKPFEEYMDMQPKADVCWLVIEIETFIVLCMVYPPTTHEKHSIGQSQRQIQIQNLFFLKALIPDSLGWLSSALLLKKGEVNLLPVMQHCWGNPTATAGTQVRAAPLNYWLCSCTEMQSHHNVTVPCYLIQSKEGHLQIDSDKEWFTVPILHLAKPNSKYTKRAGSCTQVPFCTNKSSKTSLPNLKSDTYNRRISLELFSPAAAIWRAK